MMQENHEGAEHMLSRNVIDECRELYASALVYVDSSVRRLRFISMTDEDADEQRAKIRRIVRIVRLLKPPVVSNRWDCPVFLHEAKELLDQAFSESIELWMNTGKLIRKSAFKRIFKPTTTLLLKGPSHDRQDNT